MNIDLDKIIGGLPEWNFSLTIDGGVRPVRAVTDRDVEEMVRLSKGGNDQEAKAKLQTLFAGGDPPKLDDWDGTKVAYVLTAILNYRQRHIGWGMKAVADAVEAASKKPGF